MTHAYTTTHIAMYGHVAIRRGYCSKCERYAFIDQNKLGCCGMVVEADCEDIQRMSQTPPFRAIPPRAEQKRILRQQSNQCFYCTRTFDSTVYRKGQSIHLRVTWDHIIPWVYSMDNRSQNFVAACHICNSLKGSLVFGSLEEAQVFIHEKWKEKHYTSEAPVLELQRDVHPKT